jgi:SSS family solute:Na+ symporter
MLAGLVIVPLISLFTKKPDKKLVDDAFASYDKKVMVYQREALSEEGEKASLE